MPFWNRFWKRWSLKSKKNLLNFENLKNRYTSTTSLWGWYLCQLSKWKKFPSIESVMVTGDNILTAISVGRDCKLIRPGTTIIKVEVDLIQETYSSHLNVSYTVQEDSDKNTEVSFFFFLIFCVCWHFENDVNIFGA